MLKVGIFAPYSRNETTLAATQLADWLVRVGIDVEYLACGGRPESGIHPEWDNRVVRHVGPASTYRWAYGATHLCWFVPDAKIFRQSKVVATASQRQFTRQLYFPAWVHWDAHCTYFMDLVDRVISLSRDMHLWLEDKEPVNFLQGERTWGNLISPDLLLVPRHGFTNSDEIKLLAVLPRTVVKDVGPAILDVFDFLLATHENLTLTILLESSWPRRYRRRVRSMAATYGERLASVTSPAYYDYGRHIRAHDWVYVCNTRHRYGSLLSSLAVSGVPLVAHDVPPVGGHVQDGINGRLIPCELHDGGYPVASVAVEDIGEILNSVLAEDSLYLKALQVQSRVVHERRQKAFEAMILKEFVA